MRGWIRDGGATGGIARGVCVCTFFPSANSGGSARRVFALPLELKTGGGEGRRDVGPPELVRPSSGRLEASEAPADIFAI